MENAKTIGIAILTAVFIICYLVALFGWYTFSPNDKVVGQLAPIVAVIIGYYFGRLPAEKTEQSLKEAQTDKSEAERTAAGLTEKVKNAKAALTAAMPEVPAHEVAVTLGRSTQTTGPDTAVRNAAIAALKVLES